MDPGEKGAGACAAELTSTRLESFGMERLSPPHAALGNWQSRFITPSRQNPVPDIAGMSLRHQRKRPTILRFLEIKKEIRSVDNLLGTTATLCRRASTITRPQEEPDGRRMASGEVDRNPSNEAEFQLLLSDTFEPLWKSLFRGSGEFFFPKKHPPLKLESKPIPVKDLWSFYNYRKKGALGSTVAHVVVLGLIIGVTFVKIFIRSQLHSKLRSIPSGLILVTIRLSPRRHRLVVAAVVVMGMCCRPRWVVCRSSRCGRSPHRPQSYGIQLPSWQLSPR